ncbi:MAG: glycosyltransferase [Magnetococcales bacterium]|nr:glycosyltransferase [Magnetococcales bacterium]
MKKFLIVAPGSYDGHIGGGQKYVQDLAFELLSRGNSVTVIEELREKNQHSTNQTSNRTISGVHIISVHFPLVGESIKEQKSQTGQQRREFLQDIIKKIAPDYIHINGMIPPMVAACNVLNIPYLVVCHHPGEVCPKGDLLRWDNSICNEKPSTNICPKCVIRCQKRNNLVGTVLSYMPIFFHQFVGQILIKHNPFGYLGRVLMIPWFAHLKLLGLKAYLKEAKKIVAPSNAMAKALINSGVSQEHIAIVSHGITPLLQSEIKNLENRPLKFAYVGRIDYAKGVHLLLEAMELADINKRAELHIYGDTTNKSDEKFWQKQIKKAKKPPWLHLHGAFNHSDINKIYAGIDVLLLPSIYLEVFGLVVAEAMSAGRPALVTDCGGPSQQVTDGVDGWVVDANDVGKLAEKIRWLSKNPSVVLEAAKNTRLKKDHKQYVDEIEKLLISL